MNQDLEHLKILSIFYYIVGGLAGFFACIPFIHFFFGIALVTGLFPETPEDPGAAVVGWIIIFFAGILILLGWAFAACLIVTGRFLSQKRHYTFCLVMGGIACVFMPFGTVLGVFTIILLVRESVKALFSGPPGETAGTG